MKRKTIITSVLVIVLCLGLISGSTFALFTSESKVNIAVTSGKVNVVATLKDLAVYSATADATYLSDEEKNDEAGELTGTFAGTYYYDQLAVENNIGVFANGGKATLASNLLTLDRITPGDKVSVKVDVKNYSNVAIQYRVRVNVLEDGNAAESYKLFKGLKVIIGEESAKKDLNSTILASEWTPLAAEAGIADIPVKVYLPLEAGNEYQDLKTKLVLTVEAVQGNANTSILAGINAILKASPKKNATMYDAIQELAGSYSYDILKGYVWSVDNDLFYAESDVESSFEYRFFKAYTAMPMPTEQTFSIYADPSWNTAEVNLTVGFDAGVTTDITSITYNRSAAEYGQDVVIRTNSAATSLTINAPKDTINRYGICGSVNVVAVAGSSYHENGKVAFVEIANGRLVLEKDSKVNRIHFVSTEVEQGETTDKVFTEIVVAYDSSLEDNLPYFSRDDVEIPSQGKLVVELQKVENTQEETETTSDFIWLTKQGIFEQIKVSEDGEKISEGAKWADDGDIDNDTQKASFQIANNIGRDTFGDISEHIIVEDAVYTVTLDENRDLVVIDSNSQTVSANIVVEASGLSEKEKKDAKQEEIEKLSVATYVRAQVDDILDVSTIDYNLWKYDSYTNRAYLDKAYLFKGFTDEEFSLMEKFINAKDEDDQYIFSIDNIDIDSLSQENINKALTSVETNYDIATRKAIERIIDQKSPYFEWICDFEISFDKDIEEGSVALAGHYGAFADNYNDGAWLGFGLPAISSSDEPVRLLDTMRDITGISDFHMPYIAVLAIVQQFSCGVTNLDAANVGATITVELCIYNYDTDGNQTDRIVCGRYQYTLGAVSTANAELIASHNN